MNFSFDPRASSDCLCCYDTNETQGCFYRSEVLLFSHIDLQRKPLFGNSKYIRGKLPRVWEVILNVAMLLS